MQRVAGKWQVPLLAASFFLLGYSLWRMRPPPEDFSIDQVAARIDHLLAAGDLDKAYALAGRVIGEAEQPEQAPGQIHLRAGRALAMAAEHTQVHARTASDRIVEHYDHARRGGVLLDTQDLLRIAKAYEWNGAPRRAIDHFEQALEMGVSHPDELRQHILQLKTASVGMLPEEMRILHGAFLAEVSPDRLDLKLWALERLTRSLEEAGLSDEAGEWLQRWKPEFQQTPQEQDFAWLEAWLAFATDRFEEAELMLRVVREYADRASPLDARAGYLLGRCMAAEGGADRAAEALAVFDDVLAYHLSGPYATACRLGRAEALSLMHRHREALEAYDEVFKDLRAGVGAEVVNATVLQNSLSLRAGALRMVGEPESAVGYAERAAELARGAFVESAAPVLELLGELQQELADRHTGRAQALRAALLRHDTMPLEEAARLAQIETEAQRHYSSAASTYHELARLNVTNDDAAAEAGWKAADFAEQAGEWSRALTGFERFAQEWPSHPLVPRALLRMGLIHRRAGRVERAIVLLSECYDRFPRTLDGAQALIPLAICHLGMSNFAEAERTLRTVLEDSDVFTPMAPEFADASFLLGDLLNHRGEYERAIELLEEWLERFGRDPRRDRVRFLLADSYRRSGLALKEELKSARYAAQIRRMRSEAVRRLDAAHRLYEGLVMDLRRSDPGALGPMQRTYLRLASLYRADCLFENQEYQRALKLYEEAAATYRDTTTALTAYVQVIHCHVFLGEPGEARAALARAQVMTDALPEEAFAASLAPRTRADWKNLFVWLSEAELF